MTREEIVARIAELQNQLADFTEVNRELYTLQIKLSEEDKKAAMEVKLAKLAEEGKTKEQAVARIAEVVDQIENLLKEAEQLSRDFDLSFTIDTDNMDNSLYFRSYNGTGYYEGWESSNC